MKKWYLTREGRNAFAQASRQRDKLNQCLESASRAERYRLLVAHAWSHDTPTPPEALDLHPYEATLYRAALSEANHKKRSAILVFDHAIKHPKNFGSTDGSIEGIDWELVRRRASPYWHEDKRLWSGLLDNITMRVGTAAQIQRIQDDRARELRAARRARNERLRRWCDDWAQYAKENEPPMKISIAALLGATAGMHYLETMRH